VGVLGLEKREDRGEGENIPALNAETLPKEGFDMKTVILLLSICVVWTIGLVAVAGEDPMDERTMGDERPEWLAPEKMGAVSAMPEKAVGMMTMRASELIGFKVRNQEDEYLGQITDLVFDLKDGTIAYAVLSHGGIIGIGAKLFAIPFDKFQFNADEKTAVLGLSPGSLEASPGLIKESLPKNAEEHWRQLKEIQPEREDFPMTVPDEGWMHE
jgi:sporulation protein YlmC with PRC-barrel domain